MPTIISVDATTFYNEFKKCVDNRRIKYFECVLVRSLSYYKSHCKLFLMTDKYDAGVAVENDGRIISVFKCDDAGLGIGGNLVREAIKNGGIKLECNFMKKLLLGVYYRAGFIPVTTAPLDTNDIYYKLLSDQVKYEKSEKTGDATRMMYCFYSPQLIAHPISDNYINLHKVREFFDEDTADKERDKLLKDPSKHKGYINSIVGYSLYA